MSIFLEKTQSEKFKTVTFDDQLIDEAIDDLKALLVERANTLRPFADEEKQNE